MVELPEHSVVAALLMITEPTLITTDCPVIVVEHPNAEVALVTEYVVVTVGETLTVLVPVPDIVVDNEEPPSQ